MFKRMVLIPIIILTVVAPVQAKEKAISGVLTKVAPGMVEIKINKLKTQTVFLDAETTYEKTTIYKRMAIDRHADLHSLKIGTRVRIEVRPDNPMLARKVWIVVE